MRILCKLQRIPFGVSWQPHPESIPIPLNELNLERGNWLLGQQFVQLKTAKSWGLTPYEYFALSYSERVLMVGFDRVDSKMQSYEHEYYERMKPKADV